MIFAPCGALGDKMPAPKITNKNGLVKDITSRFNVTSREARDIVTSVGTYLKTLKDIKPDPVGLTPTSSSMRAIGAASSDVRKQIKETVTAAKSGKKGTTAAQSKVKRQVTSGKKRK
jgi:hypothetical protein